MSHQIDRTSKAAKELSELLIAKSRVIGEYKERIRDIEATVMKFEEQFGIPSSQIHDAIERNGLVETEEVCDWIMAYELLQRARSTQ